MNKACPVILRKQVGVYEILAFSHPLAGNQLVKGTIENNETLEQACVRELSEESGVSALAIEFLGVWEAGFENQVWGFYLMDYSEKLPSHWEFITNDDGGHVFHFFWHRLNEKPSSEWHPVYIGAIEFIKKALTSDCGVKP